MYMGDRFEARPIATPPSIRQAMKMANVGASALPNEVTANRNADSTSSHLRPKLSLSAPATSAPTRQPINAQLLAQPERAGLLVI
jgi:hypothetical protein